MSVAPIYSRQIIRYIIIEAGSLTVPPWEPASVGDTSKKVCQSIRWWFMFWLVGSLRLYLYEPLGCVSTLWGNGCLPERNYYEKQSGYCTAKQLRIPFGRIWCRCWLLLDVHSSPKSNVHREAFQSRPLRSSVEKSRYPKNKGSTGDVLSGKSMLPWVHWDLPHPALVLPSW